MISHVMASYEMNVLLTGVSEKQKCIICDKNSNIILGDYGGEKIM